MFDSENISVFLNEKECQLWKTLRVNKSIEAVCGAFVLTYINTDIENINCDTTIGTTVKIKVNNTLILTGYVDDINGSYDEKSHELTIIGRDKTCDLVDCCYYEEGSPNEWKNQSIKKIIETFCASFGISVKVDTSVTTEVLNRKVYFKINQGETAIESLGRLCKPHGFLFLSKGEGDLTLTRFTNEIPFGQIELGINVLNSNIRGTNRDRFSKYIVKSQTAGDDLASLLGSQQLNATKTDELINRHRPLIVVADGISNFDEATKKVKWEALTRAAKSRVYEYTVPNWTVDGHQPWKPGQYVHIKDAFWGINDTFIIANIDFNFSAQENDPPNMITNLTVLPKGSFDVEVAGVKKIKNKFDFLDKL
jgi:prophage tail gpP-like protein